MKKLEMIITDYQKKFFAHLKKKLIIVGFILRVFKDEAMVACVLMEKQLAHIELAI